ncbi:hypothetical protein ACFVIM_20520 [Streptomyces sp. NPDC057638]|uniref:hypothetical protein n=1 Tax=Streptomyces sp. NPDC057638 TaxID=3346190 RepID=UPI0036B07A68
MVISMSVVLLLVVLAITFLRSGLKWSHAITCTLLGFFLAGTSMAPSIQEGVAATAEVVSGLHP